LEQQRGRFQYEDSYLLFKMKIPARFFDMKTLSRIAFLGSVFLVPALLHAADGCVNSPECPTAILGVVGAAGAALYVRWRSR
jgi:hypothetical protein